MLKTTLLPAVLGAALLACAVPTEAFLRGPSASILRAGHGGAALSTLRCQAPQPSLPLAISRRSALLTGTGLLGQVLIGNPLTTVAEGQIPQVPSDGREHNVVLTGANSGIGKDAAIKLAAGGYNVYVACRTLAKAQVRLVDKKIRNAASFTCLLLFSSLKTTAVPLDVMTTQTGSEG